MDKRTIRFGIALTYNCNMACSGCNRFLDVSPWKDSNITLEGLQEGYERAIACVNIEKVRVSGGEPLLHPQFAECIISSRIHGIKSTEEELAYLPMAKYNPHQQEDGDTILQVLPAKKHIFNHL